VSNIDPVGFFSSEVVAGDRGCLTVLDLSGLVLKEIETF